MNKPILYIPLTWELLDERRLYNKIDIKISVSIEMVDFLYKEYGLKSMGAGLYESLDPDKLIIFQLNYPRLIKDIAKNED